MAALTIKDLPTNRFLDRVAMSSISGGGAPWVFGWIRPYAPAVSRPDAVMNFYQINNSYYAEQMINQIQVVDVTNSAANSNVNVVVAGSSTNQRFT